MAEQAENGQRENVTEMHKALHDFVGEWTVTQKIWSAPNTDPVTHRGKTRCSMTLDGLGTIMITEMDTWDFKGVALITYNRKQSRYDLAWLDTISDEGMTLMQGRQSRAPSHAFLRSEFGETATQEREWTTVVAAASACLPRDALNAVARHTVAAPAAATPSGITEVPLRLVENKISENQWVLEFYAPSPGG